MRIEKLQKLVNEICAGDFTYANVALLFIWLRPAFSKDHILSDLSNFIAHSEGRDRGLSFDHVNAYVANVLVVSEKGGTIFGVPPIFNRVDVMNRLVSVMVMVGLKFDEISFRKQENSLISGIQAAMEETEFHIADSRVIRCFVKRSGEVMQFCLQANLNGPAIKMGPGATWCASLFS
jgi:hypothetical protein